MCQNWNLDPLYKGFDDPAFQADYTNLPKAIEALITFAKTELTNTDNAVSKLERYINEGNDFAR